MNIAVHLVAAFATCLVVARPLADARWVWRSPGTGILAWQFLAATVVLCLGGLAFLVSPVAGVVLGALLGTVVGRHWVRTLVVRRRHRQVLALVARQDPAVPGALILDHPLAVAYCLPGLRSRVVLSRGALDTLDQQELAAVLAHEHAHARERHDLVLLPFLALRPVWRRAADAVALLVEMRADQSAAPGSLAAALRRFTTPTPPGALGMADAVPARLQRLAQADRPLPAAAHWFVVVAGLTLVTTPLSFLVW